MRLFYPLGFRCSSLPAAPPPCPANAWLVHTLFECNQLLGALSCWKFWGWTFSRAFPPHLMDLPTILHLKVQGERRKCSANLPKTVRAGKKTELRGGHWLLPASTTIVLLVTVSLCVNFGFARVISNCRFCPSAPPQFCVGESGLDLADYRLPLSPEANRQLTQAALKRFAFSAYCVRLLLSAYGKRKNANPM